MFDWIEELKPCPFCGGNASPVQRTSNWVTICCSECGAMVPWKEYIEHAINAWNHRFHENGKE